MAFEIVVLGFLVDLRVLSLLFDSWWVQSAMNLCPYCRTILTIQVCSNESLPLKELRLSTLLVTYIFSREFGSCDGVVPASLGFVKKFTSAGPWTEDWDEPAAFAWSFRNNRIHYGPSWTLCGELQSSEGQVHQRGMGWPKTVWLRSAESFARHSTEFPRLAWYYLLRFQAENMPWKCWKHLRFTSLWDNSYQWFDEWFLSTIQAFIEKLVLKVILHLLNACVLSFRPMVYCVFCKFCFTAKCIS